MSLSVSLDEIIKEGFDYERKVMENLFRFSNHLGVKFFKVIFIHESSSADEISDFVTRNENVLFHINSKITKTPRSAWFVIQKEKKEFKYASYRYKYIGKILNGLVKYIEMAKYLKEKNENSDNR
jgi:hypothetical protein